MSRDWQDRTYTIALWLPDSGLYTFFGNGTYNDHRPRTRSFLETKPVNIYDAARLLNISHVDLRGMIEKGRVKADFVVTPNLRIPRIPWTVTGVTAPIRLAHLPVPDRFIFCLNGSKGPWLLDKHANDVLSAKA